MNLGNFRPSLEELFGNLPRELVVRQIDGLQVGQGSEFSRKIAVDPVVAEIQTYHFGMPLPGDVVAHYAVPITNVFFRHPVKVVVPNELNTLQVSLLLRDSRFDVIPI